LFRYLGDAELLARVGEFQSFNFHAEGAGQILAAVGVAGLGAVAALFEKRVAHFLLIAGLLAIAVRSARGLPILALAALPLANGALTAALRNMPGLRSAAARRLEAFLAYSRNLRAIDGRMGGWALAPLLAVAVYAALGTPALAARTGFPPEEFPVAAAAAVERLPEETRLLTPDKYGGYLIYRFAGRRKVFFDGRIDFNGGRFMKEYVRLVQVRPGWQDQIAAYGLTHALLPRDYSLAAALEAAGWRRLYGDGVAVLLEHRCGRS
jgi:hypothetical protein